jgi:hypothetical protein
VVSVTVPSSTVSVTSCGPAASNFWTGSVAVESSVRPSPSRSHASVTGSPQSLDVEWNPIHSPGSGFAGLKSKDATGGAFPTITSCVAGGPCELVILTVCVPSVWKVCVRSETKLSSFS